MYIDGLDLELDLYPFLYLTDIACWSLSYANCHGVRRNRNLNDLFVDMMIYITLPELRKI